MSDDKTIAVFKTASYIYLRERRYTSELNYLKKDVGHERSADAKCAAAEASDLWDAVEDTTSEASVNEEYAELVTLRAKIQILERDIEDMKNASDAIFERCRCGRMGEKKYKCQHCGNDE